MSLRHNQARFGRRDGLRIIRRPNPSSIYCGLFKCNPFDSDIVQTSIGPHTPIVWQPDAPGTSLSNCSLVNIRPLGSLEDINSPGFDLQWFLPAPCLSWWLAYPLVFCRRLHHLFTSLADAEKDIACAWMGIDFIKGNPLNTDIVEASVSPEPAFRAARDRLSASIGDSSQIDPVSKLVIERIHLGRHGTIRGAPLFISDTFGHAPGRGERDC
jgi:hypothetical protein